MLADNDPVSDSTPETQQALVRAAEYVRMSTEHQQYSTHNQADKIREYAKRRGLEIVRTYADEGKSGLSLEGRASLQQLIGDVESGRADFSLVLVYDVSRWGRFQDADESAYYEYICKRQGITVVYVAEQFENDGSPVSTIVKGVKRAMAGEYSRELSAKVFAGQCRLIEMGFRQGGPAGFGLRRVLIDQSGTVKGVLSRGEHKSLQTDRVVLVPGPADEVAQVIQIYDWFTKDLLSEGEIAHRLNATGVCTDVGKPWRTGSVRQVLSNPKYIGANVYNRRSFKLKKQRVVNPPHMWIRNDHAFEPVVDEARFRAAQARLIERSRRYSDEEMLDRLRTVYQTHGYLSGLLINEAPDTPSSAAYRNRFGSLTRAYQLVGYEQDRDLHYLAVNRRLRAMHPKIVQQTTQAIENVGGHVVQDPETQLLTVNGEFTVALVLARCQMTAAGARRWKLRFDAGLSPDITVAVRLDEHNESVKDYYLLPAEALSTSHLHLGLTNASHFEAFRFDALDYLVWLGARTRIRRAA